MLAFDLIKKCADAAIMQMGVVTASTNGQRIIARLFMLFLIAFVLMMPATVVRVHSDMRCVPHGLVMKMILRREPVQSMPQQRDRAVHDKEYVGCSLLNL